jgi:hypothetical protein
MVPPLIAAAVPALLGATTTGLIKSAPKIFKAAATAGRLDKLHTTNRRKCGMSIKEYRRRGGYKSRTPLCERECYKKKGHCNNGDS